MLGIIKAGTVCAAVADFTAMDIAFYINIGLVLCSFVVVTAIAILCKKTECSFVAGLSAVILFGLGMIAYVAQLILYVYRYEASATMVYLCLALLVLGFFASFYYCIMLSKNSHKLLCGLTGLFMLVPPVGAVFAAILSHRIRRDSKFRALVFNGYAFTYAALGAFCDRNGANFADSSGNEEFELLDKKGIKIKLKELKANKYTPEGMFKYGAGIMNYKPRKYKKAIRLFKKCAKSNYAPALFNLGYYCEIGIYCKQSEKKARAYYKRAADVGDVDATMRLGILEIKEGKITEGVNTLRKMEETGNLCAKYNRGVCAELGIGQDENFELALDIYTECANAGSFHAQKRIFSIAAKDINSPQNGDFFRQVTSHKFTGTFDIMIKGLVEIKKRHAADAAKAFLKAVKRHDNWEGFARCIVGTLYIDCGKAPIDRKNGAEYIKSAMNLEPSARDVYSAIPRSVIKVKTKIRNVNGQAEK